MQVIELCYTTSKAVGAKHVVSEKWNPVHNLVRKYNFSRLSTQDMKTRAVSLHVKSQVQLSLAQVKVKLAMFGG